MHAGTQFSVLSLCKISLFSKYKCKGSQAPRAFGINAAVIASSVFKQNSANQLPS